MKNPIISYVKDGFKNIVKGLGTAKDARVHTTYQQGLKITQQIANNLYVYNWLCAKVVDIPIDDATRKWISLLIPDADKKEEIEELLKEFKVKNHINLAKKWSRVFGGSVILAVIADEDQSQPIDIEKIRPGSLKNFIVLDRYHIHPNHINRDILSPNFGRPETYVVNRDGQQIHHTRLFKFFGVVPTLRELEEQNFWGNSLFTKLWEPISDSQTLSQSISNLVLESNVDVYRIAGLNQLVAQGKDEIVTKRLKIAHEMKSIINGIALDKEDEYDKKTNQFATLDSIDDNFKQTVSGSADIPVTRLWGRSPAGENATGESDMLNYYDNVQSVQENELRDPIDWMAALILANASISEVLKYEFKPLKQLTEVEEADVDSKKATRDQIYLDQGVVEPIDVMAELAENGTYATIDENRVEEERKESELEFDEGEE